MIHASLKRIEGPNLVLRLIEPEDAAYVHGLRTDPAYNRYLSQVYGTVEDQKRWIEAYKTREAEGIEYYYVIERRDGVPCGLIRLYGVGQDNCTWGSWVLDHNKPAKAALESIYLSYLVVFDLLHLSEAYFDVRKDNERALAVYRRLGATQIEVDSQSIYFVYPRARYEMDRAGFEAQLVAAAREAKVG